MTRLRTINYLLMLTGTSYLLRKLGFSNIISRPARVLLISPQPFFSQRGTPLNVRAMVETLASAGYLVDLLVYPYGEDIELPGVRVFRSPRLPFVTHVPVGPSFRKLFLDVLMLFKACWIGLSGRYVLIHGVEDGAFMGGVVSVFRRVPFIYDMDSCMISQLKQSGFISSEVLLSGIAYLEKGLARRSTAIITMCKRLSEKAEEMAPGVPVYQLEDFPIDSTERICKADVLEIQKRLKFYEKKVILYTGNFSEYQGVDLLLEAFSLLPEKIKAESKLLLVGSGSEEADCRALAEKLNIQDFVIWEGLQPLSRMSAYMSISSVLVSPRRYGDNTPLKLYTYMMARKPIVATNISAHTQVLNSQTAYLVDSNSFAFAKGLEQVLDNLPDSKHIVEKAYQEVTTKFSREQFNTKLLKAYKEIIGDPQLSPFQEESALSHAVNDNDS